jgi:hypothetical protein
MMAKKDVDVCSGNLGKPLDRLGLTIWGDMTMDNMRPQLPVAFGRARV